MRTDAGTESFAECQMQKHDKLSFKEEIKTYVRLAMNSTETRTLEDVVEMLKKIYLMDIRLKGNTISYALPYMRVKQEKRRLREANLGTVLQWQGSDSICRRKSRSRWNTGVLCRI